MKRELALHSLLNFCCYEPQLSNLRTLKLSRPASLFLFPWCLNKQASLFYVVCWRFFGREFCEVAVSGDFSTDFERVKRRCADVASQMQCPHHFRNPKLEMWGENFDDFSVEVITCCEEFQRRVEKALDTLLTHKV